MELSINLDSLIYGTNHQRLPVQRNISLISGITVNIIINPHVYSETLPLMKNIYSLLVDNYTNYVTVHLHTHLYPLPIY